MRRKLVVLGVILALATNLVGCNKDAVTADDRSDYTVTVICKSQDSYWDAVKNGVADAESETGIHTVYMAPDTEDVDKQIELINKAVGDKTDALLIAPVTEDGLNDALQNAVSSGVMVFTIDSNVSFEGVESSIGTNNSAAAYIAGRYALENIQDSDKNTIGIISHSLESQTAIERYEGFKDQLEALEGGKDLSDITTQLSNEKASGDTDSVDEDSEVTDRDNEVTDDVLDATTGITVLDAVDCGGDIDKSKESAIELIKNNEDIGVIYATNQPGTIGVCEAVDELVKSGDIEIGEVKVIGFDYFDGADAYLNNGVLQGVIVQNPYNMGYLGVRYAIQALDGEGISHELDTGVTLVTKDNLNDANVQFLIQ